MNHEHPEYKKFMQNRQPPNPVFLKVWELMVKNGDLKGLSDDEALEAVVSTTERLIEGATEDYLHHARRKIKSVEEPKQADQLN